MRNTEVHQVAFDKGIIENIKSDVFQEGRRLDGLLYLENYNPNLEHMSLVKRPGQVTILDQEENNDIISIAQLSDYMPHWISKGDLFLKGYNSLFCALKLKTSNPNINDTYVLFARRLVESIGDDFSPYGINDAFPATAVIARTIETENDSPSFKEAFKDGRTFPGWYPIGTMRDYSRYGESLLFVTTLENVGNVTTSSIYSDSTGELKSFIQNLYPVYKWDFWDLSKKRKEGDHRFWNGILFPGAGLDNPEFKLWKVNIPTQRLTKGVFGGAYILGKQENTTYGPGATRKNTYFKEDELLVPEDGNTIFDISMVFWETNLNKDSYFSKESTDRLYDPVDKRKDRAVAHWTKENVFTIETLNDERFNGNVNTYLGAYYSSGKISPFNGTGSPTRSIYFAKSSLIGTSDTSYFIAIATHLPDYIKAKIPRLWLKDDTIPYLLTAVVNGVEIIVHRGIYTSRYGGEALTPSSSTIEFPEQSMRDIARTIDEFTVFPPNNKVYLTTSPFVNYDTPLEHIITADPYIQIKFALRMTEAGFETLLNSNVTSIKFYVSKPDVNRSLFKSTGLTFNEPNPITYAKPLISKHKQDNETDLDGYGLIKEFLITGLSETKVYYDDYVGTPPISTNAWIKGFDFTGQFTYWSQPMANDGTYDVRKKPGTNPSTLEHWAAQNMESDETWWYFNNWSPDNTIWDYPSDAPPLTLGSSGKYWKGIGAEQITVIKGRTFIAGTNEDGVKEQAKVRYSMSQSGAISPDVFVEEDYLNIGHLPITALVEYREELVAFNRELMYRLALPEIMNPLTWEFLETTKQGTFSPKTVAVTPHGICYANDNGIWISQGGLPESLTDNPEVGLAILSMYQTIATFRPYIYTAINDIGIPLIDPTLKYNKYMELMYDEINDELVLISPMIDNIDQDTLKYTDSGIVWNEYQHFTSELRLIFNFSKKNWRTERISLIYNDATKVIYIETANNIHRQHFNNPDIATCRLIGNDMDNLTDYYMEYGQANSLFLSDVMKMDNIFINEIIGILVTHDIGDGINDYLLQNVIIECSPRDSLVLTYADKEFTYTGWQNYLYSAENQDPKLIYEPRARTWHRQSVTIGNIDGNDLANEMEMVKRNWKVKGGINPFNSVLQTPNANTIAYRFGETQQRIIDKMTARESLILLAPIQTKFRRKRFKFESKIVAKIRSLNIKTSQFSRRHL